MTDVLPAIEILLDANTSQTYGTMQCSAEELIKHVEILGLDTAAAYFEVSVDTIDCWHDEAQIEIIQSKER